MYYKLFYNIKITYMLSLGQHLSPDNNRRTKSMSFRVDIGVLEEVAGHAGMKGTSVNVLVNQILKRYVDFNVYEQPLGILHLPKGLVMEMFDVFDDQKIHVLAKKTYQIIRDSVLVMQHSNDAEAYLDVLERYLAPASFCRISSQGSEKTIEIVHNAGMKFSEFLKQLLSIIFEKNEEIPLDFELTERCIMATVRY